jgi:hypothetical protein
LLLLLLLLLLLPAAMEKAGCALPLPAARHLHSS